MKNVINQHGRRVSSRLRICVPAKFDLVTGLNHCFLMDVSRTGAHLKMPGLLALGDCGILKLDSIDSFGAVVWRHDDDLGICFDEDVSNTNLLSLRHFADSYIKREREATLASARSYVAGKKYR